MKHFTLLSIFIIALFGCKRQPSGPFFGNGLHNGWADQNSVVIWTRLTSQPEMNREGPSFLIPSAEEHRHLDQLANPDSIWHAQVPAGF